MKNKQNEYYVDDIVTSSELKNYVIASRVMSDVKAAIDTTKTNCQKYTLAIQSHLRKYHPFAV